MPVNLLSENKKGEAVDLALKSGLRKSSILRRRGFGHDVYAAAALVEQNFAVRKCKQSPIAACADVFARDKLTAALADNDAARRDDRTAKFFYAETLADAVASVFDAALTFFMCHKILSVDCRDFDDGQFLAVTDGLVISLAAFHLEC